MLSLYDKPTVLDQIAKSDFVQLEQIGSHREFKTLSTRYSGAQVEYCAFPGDGQYSGVILGLTSIRDNGYGDGYGVFEMVVKLYGEHDQPYAVVACNRTPFPEHVAPDPVVGTYASLGDAIEKAFELQAVDFQEDKVLLAQEVDQVLGAARVALALKSDEGLHGLIALASANLKAAKSAPGTCFVHPLSWLKTVKSAHLHDVKQVSLVGFVNESLQSSGVTSGEFALKISLDSGCVFMDTDGVLRAPSHFEQIAVSSYKKDQKVINHILRNQIPMDSIAPGVVMVELSDAMVTDLLEQHPYRHYSYDEVVDLVTRSLNKRGRVAEKHDDLGLG